MIIWRNAFFFLPCPELETFPNHVHLGDDKDAKESATIDLRGVLEVLKNAKMQDLTPKND
jgi:hypothetical protein